MILFDCHILLGIDPDAMKSNSKIQPWLKVVYCMHQANLKGCLIEIKLSNNFQIVFGSIATICM